MAIDIHNEKLISFHELPKRLPSGHNGKPISLSTIYRWRGKGVRGIKLEAIKIGGTWVTTEQAFARFVAQTNLESDSCTNKALVAPGLLSKSADSKLLHSGW